MRRISLALALLGAIAAAGCGGSTSSTDSGSNRGIPGTTFTVTVRLPTGGTVRSGNMTGTTFTADNRIVCGTGGGLCSADYLWDPALALSVVALQATADAGKIVEGWAGDCQGGDSVCVLSGKADKYVLVRFNDPGAVTGHPNWSPALATSTLHVQAARSFSLQCNRCHGLDWTGQGIAPSCYQCHNLDALTVSDPVLAVTQSGHFDLGAAAWGTHDGKGWGQDCQRCHTNQGFRDYIGQLDGIPNYLSGTFRSDATATTPPAGTGYAYGPLQCKTCHNSVSDPNYAGLTRIMFPSGAVVTADPATALCGQCHEARESTVSMDAGLAVTTNLDGQLAAGGVDFRNPHYRGAAATMWGSVAKGWAQYPGQIYTGQNKHGVVEGSCVSCHDPHTLEVNVTATTCGRCHFDEATGLPVANMTQLEDSRQFGFEGDIDGDGVAGPLKGEIAGLNAKLLEAIQAYAFNVTGQGICFSDATYPYFINHGAASGDCTPAELALGRSGAFKKFTPRLMRAAYNLKFSVTDFGAWAHNPRYAIEILFDAIADLNAGLGSNAVAFTGARTFAGHFGGAEVNPAGADAFTDWNSAGQIPSACSMCHGADTGLANYFVSLATTTTGPAAAITTPSITGFQCTTCHAPQQGDADFKRMRAVARIYLPPEKPDSQQTVFDPSITSSIAAGDRVCMTCHTGREGMKSVTAKGFKSGWTNGFTNPHYLGAFGVMLGSNAQMLWQYGTNSYAGYPAFWNGMHGSPHAQRCTSCHNPQGTGHSFEINTATTVPSGTYQGAANTQACDGCHVQTAHGDFRLAPKKANVQRLSDALYSTIQAYAAAAVAAGTPGAARVCYSGSYPYWFKDTNGDGTCDATEAVSANGAKFDAAGAKAAFNYKWSQAEPGAYAHNYEYMAQALIDSILDLNPAATLPFDAAFDPGNTTTAIVRP